MKFVPKLVILLALLFSMLVFAGEEELSNEVKKLFNEGNQALKARDYGLALEKYKAAVAGDPNFAQGYYWAGIAYKIQKEYPSAIKSFQNAIDKDSKYVRAYVSLGEVQAKLEKHNEAINSYQAALNIDPAADKANRGMGDVYRDLKNYDKAIESYQKELATDATDGLAWRSLGLSYAEQQKYADAVDAFSKATGNMKDRNRKADAFMRLGNAQLELKKYDDAKAAYTSSLSLARSSVTKGGANYGMGMVLRATGQRSEARKYFVQAARDRNWKRAADYEIDRIDNPHKYGE